MARILGIDLGSYSAKAVLVESTMRSVQLRGYGAVRRGEGTAIEALRAALEPLFPPHAPRADQVMVCLPGPSLVTHSLTLPFTDTKQIEAALSFEVESLLPFDLSEAVYDYQIVGQQDQKSTLLVGVVRKEELRRLLDDLKQLELDPRVVTHPAAAYRNLIIASPELFRSQADSSPFAIVDIGHERTAVAVLTGSGAIEFARTFVGGGQDLTRAIATEFSISAAEAEQWKETQGAVGPAVKGQGAERAAQALLLGLQPVLREIRATLKAFTARTRRNVTQVYLAGGTSKLLGLDEQFAQSMGIPAALLQLPAGAAEVIPPAEQLPAAQAYALALRKPGSSKASFLNLRQGEFAFRGDFDYARQKIAGLAAYAAILLVLLIVSGVVRNSVLAQREKDVDAVLCQTTQRVLGQCEKNFDRALNLLKGKESPAGVIPKLSATSLLAAWAERIPPEIPVTFDQIVIETDRMQVRGDTDGPEQIDKITSALKTFHCFREVKEGKVESKGGKTNFRLDILVACPEQGTPPSG